MPRSFALAAVSALALCAATPAFSQQYETVSTVVYFGDLDIYSDSGAGALLGRINRATHRICDDHSIRSVSDRSNEAECRQGAIEQAVSDLDNPIVTAQYYGVTPEVVISEADQDSYSGELVVKKPG